MYAVLVISAVMSLACSLRPTQLMGAGQLQPQLVVGRCVYLGLYTAMQTHTTPNETAMSS